MAKRLTVRGEPATQVGIALKNSTLAQLKQSGKIENISIAGYVRTLIDNDLKQVSVVNN